MVSKKAYVIMFSSCLEEDPEPEVVYTDKQAAEKYCKDNNKELEYDEGDIFGFYIREVELKGGKK
jgi:hypothetical protein